MKLPARKFLSWVRVRVSKIAGRRVIGYPALVDQLLVQHSYDKAMIDAVGGHDEIGDVELALLDRFGLAADSYVIDVGCGSGRLTRRLARLPRLRYLGTDVSEKLLDHAAETSGRADFQFKRVEWTRIPEQDGVADMVVFFSVGTHLLHEEFFLYLEDARRVLRPGGRIIFSFLDLMLPAMRTIFMDTVNTTRRGWPFPLVSFIGRNDIPIWANMLGMKLIALVRGDDPIGEPSAPVRALIGRSVADDCLGQSTAVLEKI